MLNELEAMPEHGAIIGNQNATQNKNEGDNITSIKKVTKPKRGTSPSYLTKRLKRDAPELFSKVVSGELSAHKAGQPAKENIMTKIYQHKELKAEKKALRKKAESYLESAKSIIENLDLDGESIDRDCFNLSHIYNPASVLREYLVKCDQLDALRTVRRIVKINPNAEVVQLVGRRVPDKRHKIIYDLDNDTLVLVER